MRSLVNPPGWCSGGQGAYHLIVLDSAKRTVSIRPYPIARLEQANIDYGIIEERTKAGEAIEAVLVSAGPIDALRKAYPNYFLDTQEFVARVREIVAEAHGVKANNGHRALSSEERPGCAA